MSRQNRITSKIQETLSPLFLEVQNESRNHHVPAGSETHFKVIVVSEKFENMTRLDRHRMVMALLEDEFQNGLHALSLHLYTSSEWENRKKAVLDSPKCRDGFDV